MKRSHHIITGILWLVVILFVGITFAVGILSDMQVEPDWPLIIQMAWVVPVLIFFYMLFAILRALEDINDTLRSRGSEKVVREKTKSAASASTPRVYEIEPPQKPVWGEPQQEAGERVVG